MRVYLAGPMTGLPQFNYPAFERAAARLRGLGHEVVSPAEMDDPRIREISMLSMTGDMDTLKSHGVSHGDFLARDVKVIADDGIQAVVVLPGWETSSGARHETFVAYLEGLPIVRMAQYAPNEPLFLDSIPAIALFRAWAGRRDLILTGTFGGAMWS
jgi:hypothetical protein